MAVTDNRNQSKKNLTLQDRAVLYGYRLRIRADVWCLSPYELAMYWEPVMHAYPKSLTDNKSGLCHAVLTKSGKHKVNDNPEDDADLLPGTAYFVNGSGDQIWVASEDVPGTRDLRNTWILRRHR